MAEKKSFTLAELANLTNSIVIGDSSAVVDNLSTLENSSDTSITFLANSKYIKFLKTTKAKAVVVHNKFDTDIELNYLQSDDPYLVFAKLSALFKEPSFELDTHSIHPTAVISNEAIIGDNVSIGANVYIGPGCNIDENVVIKPNCSLVRDVYLGKNSIIQHGAVLGSDGFGYAPSDDGYVKIEQIGKLIIGSNVEIGAGCTIDRGALGNTEIHDGVKLDNQVHLAHNVILGKNSAIAACCAIAGSTVIGKNFQMGGLSGILGHISICDDVIIGAHTLITKTIKESGNYIGIMPAQKQKDWAKSSIFIKKRI
ncbi:MAG: UDP-3-O-[3-hydroxymyristoyl] glucosamine N-acyltransferase [Gammaproteobacteria bacterium]